MNIKLLFTTTFLIIFSSITGQETINKLRTPPYLQKGDTIVIIAPAGILKNKEETLQKAKNLAESWGLIVVFGKHLFNQNNSFSGTDEERTEDFQKALDNPNIKAIWAARGGYGSVRILDALNFSKFKKKPKWIVGYSDITVFHNHLHHLGFETIHGMMAVNLDEKPEKINKTIASFKKVLFGEEISYTILSSTYNRNASSSSEQVIDGQLIGGNLAILNSMLGSDSQISTEDKILFIEEIGEYKYAIDRMLQSLKRAGYFSKVSAVIVGNMTKVKKNSTSWGSSIEQLILDVIPKQIPVLFNFPAGHEADNRALIFGRDVELTISNRHSSVVFKK